MRTSTVTRTTKETSVSITIDLVSELADLVYHLSVLMVDAGIGWEEVEGELGRRSAPK